MAVSSLTTPTALSLRERRQAAANARGSVLAERLDPSGAEPIVTAWTRGEEIDAGEMVEQTLAQVARRHGEPSRPPAAA